MSQKFSKQNNTNQFSTQKFPNLQHYVAIHANTKSLILPAIALVPYSGRIQSIFVHTSIVHLYCLVVFVVYCFQTDVFFATCLTACNYFIMQFSISWLPKLEVLTQQSTYLACFLFETALRMQQFTHIIIVSETIESTHIVLKAYLLLGQHTQRWAINVAVIVPVAVTKAPMIVGIPVFTNVLCPPTPVGPLAVAVHVSEQQNTNCHNADIWTCNDYYVILMSRQSLIAD